MEQINYYQASTTNQAPHNYSNPQQSNLRPLGEIHQNIQQIQYQPMNPQYNPSNAPYIQTADIQQNLAAGTAKWVQSTYAHGRPSAEMPIFNIPSNQNLMEDINYAPPYSERPFVGTSMIPQIQPQVTSVKSQGLKQNYLDYLKKCCSCCTCGESTLGSKVDCLCWNGACLKSAGICTCCPFTKPSNSVPQVPRSTQGLGSSYYAQTIPPNPNMNISPQTNLNSPYFSQPSTTCGCSRGLDTLKLHNSYNQPGIGYHGIGYDMIGPYCCDGPGGCRSGAPFMTYSSTGINGRPSDTCGCMKGIFSCC